MDMNMEHHRKNGIMISEISYETVQSKRVLEVIAERLLLLCGIFGCTLCLFTSFTSSFDFWFLLLLQAVMTGVLSVCAHRIRKPAVAFGVVFMLILLAGLLNGHVLKEELVRLVAGITDPAVLTDKFPLLTWGCGSAAPWLFILEEKVLKSRTAEIVTTLLCVAGCFLCNKVPSMLALALSGAFLAGLLADGERGTRGKRQPAVLIKMTAATVFLVVCFCVSVIISGESYKRLAFFDSVRAGLENYYHEARLAEGEEGEQTAGGGISGGKLGTFDTVEYQHTPMLTYRSGVLGTIYLRGFVGTQYQDNTWSDLTETQKAKYSTFEREMDDAHVDLINQTATLFKLVDSDEQIQQQLYENRYVQNVVKREFSVDYSGDDATYWYIPYGNMSYAPAKSSIDGTMLNTKGRKIESMAYTVFDNDYEKYKELVDSYDGSNQMFRQYCDWEQKYRAYVHQVYTGGDIAPVKNLLANLGETVNDDEDRTAFINSLKKYLQDNYRYTLSPGKVPANKDFVSYFLNESHAGYCTYFASAAVLALRAEGIPARYVEGYCVNAGTKDFVQTVSTQRISSVFNYTENYKEFEVNVLDSDAHAWVEVYEDGYGWVPVDFTPGHNGLTKDGQPAESENRMEQLSIDNSADLSENQIVKETVNANTVPEEGTSDMPQDDEDNEAYDSIAEYGRASHNNHIEPDVLLRILYNRVKKYLVAVAYVILAILAILLAMSIPMAYRMSKNAKMFCGAFLPDRKKQCDIMYAYLVRLCGFAGIRRQKGMSYQSMMERLIQKLPAEQEELAVNAFQAVLQMRFGKDGCDADTLRDAAGGLQKLQKYFYGKANRKQKFSFLYRWYLK